jgi:hypothetical protein
VAKLEADTNEDLGSCVEMLDMIEPSAKEEDDPCNT